jgi:GntR family transcriptional repressor for pyruvate dehydrogenase complex
MTKRHLLSGLLVQVRRILEPAAIRFAASRITDDELTELHSLLHRMSTAGSHEELVEYDEAFHHVVAEAVGNATLASMLNGCPAGPLADGCGGE